MTTLQGRVIKSGEITLTIKEMIELLEYKLQCLKKAQEEDSSWSYNIEEVQDDINYLKSFYSSLSPTPQ